MGMSIDEAIEILHERDKCMEYVTDNDSEAFDMAIETMRKYQKIKEIYKSWRTGDYKGSTECMEEIGEVLKDGND